MEVVDVEDASLGWSGAYIRAQLICRRQRGRARKGTAEREEKKQRKRRDERKQRIRKRSRKMKNEV